MDASSCSRCSRMPLRPRREPVSPASSLHAGAHGIRSRRARWLSASRPLPAAVVARGGEGGGLLRSWSRLARGVRIIEELASLLGGAVGCSRAVTMAGWRPHTDQVGQTGTKIAPDIYIACGISGATQHMAGCKGAKAILAVNTDPEAPILASADYAVIGDLHEVVPAISAGIRNAQTQKAERG